MQDRHYIVEIFAGHQFLGSIDVAAADEPEAYMIGQSQIRLKVKKGYGKIEVPKSSGEEGLPSYLKTNKAKQGE